MSKAFRDLTKFKEKPITPPALRKACQRPGRLNKEGLPIYTTEQAHKDTCDVNNIIRKYDKTGLITHVNTIEAKYGDMTGFDFQKAQNLIISANQQFDKLPAKIKKRFNYSMQEYLDFFDNPDNRDEAIKLGLISKDTPEDRDGLGEHVTDADKTKASEEKT